MADLRYSVRAATLAVALLLWAQPTQAIQQPSYLHGWGLRLATGERMRQTRTVRFQPAPASQRAAWQRLVDQPLTGARLGRAMASWDEATGVPSRIVLTGLSAPTSATSAAAAEQLARRMLERHLVLLAPGAAPGDFVRTVNHAEYGLRTVAYAQHHRGMPVLGGQVSFRFKADSLVLIGSEALPDVDVELPPRVIDADQARHTARRWIEQEGATSVAAAAVEGPFVLALIGPHRLRGYRAVMRVDVSSERPLSRWAVYLDAASGERVAREQTLRFAQGTLLMHAPVRYPAGGRADFPAVLANVNVDGGPTTTDDDGIVTFADGGPVAVELFVEGVRVNVNNAAGDDATDSFTLSPGGSVTWSATDDEFVDAQLSAFVHANRAKAHAKALSPTLSWLDAALPVNVNIDDRCNAFYDSTSLNFFAAGGPCENTARVADVVYHEFGHGFHHHALLLGSGQFDEALSEGLSDYFAASISNDPAMGRGFFLDEQPLRHIDPPDYEHTWPFDVSDDPHYTGLIMGGALWDLRKALVAKLGEAEGAATTDLLFYQAMKNATDIPSTYVEVLVADDDDGNVDNGTPNGCEINQAFGAHGLRAIDIETSAPDVVSAEQDGYDIFVTVNEVIPSCQGEGVESVELHWRLRHEPRDMREVAMSGGPEQWHAQIPQQPIGSVVQYRLTVRLSDTGTVVLPANRADPMYELFVGDVVPLYCTDFEIDPFDELLPAEQRWTHGLSSGDPVEGADDWQWGEPGGRPQSGDPAAAHSGAHVIGNDLGHGQYDGNYQPDKVNFTKSPLVQVGEFDNVRLQYRRWLNVEDGYFDQATIYANEEPVWTNFDSMQGDGSDTHHMDRAWRFHDVDLSGAVSSGAVQLTFEIASDGGMQLGGWTLDDLCVVAFERPPEPVCGNGLLEEGEQCDDGNTAAGDGCGSSCLEESAAEPADDRAILTPDGGCACRAASEPTPRRSLWLAVVAALGMMVVARRCSRRP